MRRIVAFITDFGADDPYAGQMEAVVASLAPDARVVHVTHGIPPQRVELGAHVVAATAPLLPRGAVLAAVVDPGVGTGRRGIILRCADRWLVGPDNGLLTAGPAPAGAWELDRPEYWRPEPAATFHGRDVFAPVAAHLASYLRPDEMASVISDPVPARARLAQAEAGEINGKVVHVDRFGNLITNVPGRLTPPGADARIEIAGAHIEGVRRAYGQGDGLLALVGSWNLLEVAVRNGSAADVLGAGVGASVRVHLPTAST